MKSWNNPSDAIWRTHDRGLYMGTNTKSGKAVYLPLKWLPTHVWIQGPPGVGKSALLLWLFGLLCRIPRASVILINPKGALAHLARDYAFANGFGKRVVMLDPGEQDHIVGYNPLRANDLALATHAKAVRAGIRAAWGQASFDQTAQLARLLFLVLFAARQLKLTLIEAVGLLRPGSALRAAILPQIQDPNLRESLEYIDSLGKGRQEELLASSLARLENWCVDPNLRRMFTQQEHAIDLDAIMRERGILIANLELYKPLVQDDVTLLSRLLVNDIVAHCFARSEEERTPVFLLIDEVHTVASSDLCHALSLGRELGLHCVLAHQHEAQLREETTVPGLADALLNCARTKILFGGNAVRHLELTIKEFFADAVDVMKVKDERHALELDPIETRRVVVSEGVSQGRTASWTRGDSTGITEGRSSGRSRSWTRGRSRGSSDAVTHGKTRGRSWGTTTGRTETESWSDSEGETHGTNSQQGTTHTQGTAHTSGVAVSVGSSSGSNVGAGQGQTVLPTGDVLITDNDTSGESSGEFAATTVMSSDTESASVSQHESRGVSASRSAGHTSGGSTGYSEGTSEGTQTSQSRSHSRGRNESSSDAETEGTHTSTSHGTSRGRQRTRGGARSTTRSESRSLVPFYAYKKRRVVSTRTFMPPDEQFFQKLQEVQALPPAHYVLKAGNNPAVFLRAPFVETPRISRRRLTEGLERVHSKPYYGRAEEIDEEERERLERLLSAEVDEDE